MQKRWVLKERGDQEAVMNLAEELKISPVLSELLVQRDITTYEEARAFFRPDLNNLHDPFLMKDMDKAVARIVEAIDKNEKILIYGDYDVDGTTAVSLMYLFLKEIGCDKLNFYIPDRYTEGYGISYEGINYAASEEYSLVIALDCGIKAVEKIARANELDIDFIICDHHRPGEKLPAAVAVLDPKREDCPYPFKGLSGCGVGFKLAQAIAKKTGLPPEITNKYLDLVVVSIAADIVPITGENRILAHYGLALLNSHPRPGVEAVLSHSNISRKPDDSESEDCIFNRELTISDMVFILGPRINAAGRIENGRNSVELLISENKEQATELARQINLLNTTRRDLDANTTEMALSLIENDDNKKAAYTTVLYHSEWSKGVIGIVASRLIETYYRPTIVLTESNGLITGSARSIKDFDIYDAIDSCSDLLEHFGGHKYAAGLSLKPENLETFISRFEEITRQCITEEMMTPEIEVDMKITLNEIEPKFYRILKQFAPFGPGNMKPVFQTDDVVDNGYGKRVGKNHLKLTLGHREIASSRFPAIAFQQGDHIDRIQSGKSFNVCYHIEENKWNGRSELQLNIKDIAFPPNGESKGE